MPFPVTDPEIVGKGVKVKVAISSRRQAFTGTVVVDAATVPERFDSGNASRLIPVHRHSDIEMGFLSISYGVTDDPIDELIIIMLTMHPDTLPLTGDDFGHFLDAAFWNASQNWRLGDATGWVQTLEREQALIAEEAIFTDASLKQDSYHIGLLVVSSVTSSVRVDGVVNWNETLYQRSWPSRNNSEWSGWGYKMDEENYGQFGS